MSGDEERKFRYNIVQGNKVGFLVVGFMSEMKCWYNAIITIVDWNVSHTNVLGNFKSTSSTILERTASF